MTGQRRECDAGIYTAQQPYIDLLDYHILGPGRECHYHWYRNVK